MNIVSQFSSVAKLLEVAEDADARAKILMAEALYLTCYAERMRLAAQLEQEALDKKL